MLRCIAYWREERSKQLFGAEERVYDFLNRPTIVRFLGSFVEKNSARSPVELIRAIATAKERDAVILIPYSPDVTRRAKFREEIIRANVEVRSLDRAFSSFEEFKALSHVFDIDTQNRRERAKSSAYKRPKPNKPSSTVKAEGCKTAAKIAMARRQIAAQDITLLLAQYGEDLSPRRIADLLNERQVPTLRSGSIWRRESVKKILNEIRGKPTV